MAESISATVEPRICLPGLLDWITEQIAPIAKSVIHKKAQRLYRLLNEAFFDERPHSDPIRYAHIPAIQLHEQFLWAQSFTEKELKSGGMGGNEGNYQRFIRLFFDFPEGNQGYDKAAGVTKPYMLKPEVAATLTDFWRGRISVNIEDAVTGNPIDGGSLSGNGVIRSSFSKLRVPPLIPIDLDKLNRAIALQESAGGIYGERASIRAKRDHVISLRLAYGVRQWVRVLGGIPNLYADFKLNEAPSNGTGRLYGIGPLHLQRLARYARRMIYAGTGWWDYDFRACHPAIMLALMKAYGCDCGTWEDYLANRDERNEELAEEIDVKTRKMKDVINALVYGQPLSGSVRYSSLVAMIGSHAVERLKESLYYRALKEERTAARSVIIKKHSHGSKLMNAVGKIVPLNATPQPKPNSLLSTILTGYEAWAVNQLCDGIDDLKVIMHDGWVSASQQDILLMESHLQNLSESQFGFPLNLRLKAVQFL